MDYRQLGRTDLRVSSIGFGAAALGGVYGSIDESRGITALRTSLDLGVNFIDVSPYYGVTKAETVLGNPESVVQATGSSKHKSNVDQLVGKCLALPTGQGPTVQGSIKQVSCSSPRMPSGSLSTIMMSG